RLPSSSSNPAAVPIGPGSANALGGVPTTTTLSNKASVVNRDTERIHTGVGADHLSIPGPVWTPPTLSVQTVRSARETADFIIPPGSSRAAVAVSRLPCLVVCLQP